MMHRIVGVRYLTPTYDYDLSQLKWVAKTEILKTHPFIGRVVAEIGDDTIREISQTHIGLFIN
jgi:hypothetical protein